MRPNFLLLWAAAGVACSAPPSPPDAGQPQVCVGGVLRPNGACEAKCTPSKCVANNTCVDNKCMLKCTSHQQCQKYVQQCLAAKEDDTGADIFVCTPTPVREYGDPCPNGNECSAYCHSSGPGDAKSYCTFGCTSDSDCPGGYECGYERDPRGICATDGGPTKGKSDFCGTPTSEPCVERTSIGPDAGLVEGQFCLLRRVCLKREACAPCQSDVDCSWGFALDCVQIQTGEKRCAPKCAQEQDCEADKICGNGHCLPRVGSCEGAHFCNPCRYDVDCGPNHACAHLHGNEKSCIDVTFSLSCTTAADCPVSPGGRHGACLNEEQRMQPGDDLYHRCYAPYDAVNNSYSCYLP